MTLIYVTERFRTTRLNTTIQREYASSRKSGIHFYSLHVVVSTESSLEFAVTVTTGTYERTCKGVAGRDVEKAPHFHLTSTGNQ
jgi:hypothetical protein